MTAWRLMKLVQTIRIGILKMVTMKMIRLFKSIVRHGHAQAIRGCFGTFFILGALEIRIGGGSIREPGPINLMSSTIFCQITSKQSQKVQ